MDNQTQNNPKQNHSIQREKYPRICCQIYSFGSILSTIMQISFHDAYMAQLYHIEGWMTVKQKRQSAQWQ